MPQSQAQPQRPRRLLALDPGEQRTGVALSDELGLYAHPRPAIRGGRNAVIEAVAALSESEGVSEVIVGLPLSLSGGESAQTASVRELVTRLRERLDIPVTEWDERLSSVQAGRSVRGAARRKSGELDSAAAALVLQAVLDSRRPGARP